MTPGQGPPSRLRVAYIEHCTPCWPDVAARLRGELGWEPVYWVGPPQVAKMVMPLFPDIIFHSRYDANHLRNPPQLAHVSHGPLDEPYVRAMSEVQLVAMKMLDAFDSLDAFTFDERARFVRQRLRYWKSIVAALRLDIVLFPFSPHTVYDYLIQEICRADGIRTVMFENAYPIDFATFFTMDSPHSGSVELQEQLAGVPDDGASPVPPLFEAYLQRTRSAYSAAIPWYMREQFENFPADLAKNVFAAERQSKHVDRRRHWWPW